jgi:hypothetical protein
MPVKNRTPDFCALSKFLVGVLSKINESGEMGTTLFAPKGSQALAVVLCDASRIRHWRQDRVLD